MRKGLSIGLALVLVLIGFTPAIASAQANPTAGQAPQRETGQVQQRVENRKGIAKMKAERLRGYIARHIEVLKSIIARMETRIAKIETRGLSAEGQTKLESAKKNLVDAKTLLGNTADTAKKIVADVESVLGGDDVRKGLSDAKKKIGEPRKLLADAIAKIKAARQDIAGALGTVTAPASRATTSTTTSSAN